MKVNYDDIHQSLILKSSKFKELKNQIFMNGVIRIPKPKIDFFAFMVKTIISQQISDKAANSIWKKFCKYFDKNTISYFSKGGGGADIGPLHRRTGTPMFGLSIDGQKYFEIHHTAKDVFEAVHPREMELGTASMASLVYLIDKYGL